MIVICSNSSLTHAHCHACCHDYRTCNCVFFTPQIVPLLLNFRRRDDKRTLQHQINEYRRELSKIHQVDEFAKYSKVQRKLRASQDQLNGILRQDLELNLKYVLVLQAIVYVIALGICFKLIFIIYDLIIKSLNQFAMLFVDA